MICHTRPLLAVLWHLWLNIANIVQNWTIIGRKHQVNVVNKHPNPTVQEVKDLMDIMHNNKLSIVSSHCGKPYRKI